MTSCLTLFLSLFLFASTLHAQNPTISTLYALPHAPQENSLDQVVG